MKKSVKISLWVVGGLALLVILIVGGKVIWNYIEEQNRFEKTTICPNLDMKTPVDKVFTVNGVSFKMIGIKGGTICCKGLTNEIELGNFYLGETEVTQELWEAVMGDNPSLFRDSTTVLPVETVSLVDCMDFINKLDSISGVDFYVPSYPHWSYAACLGNESEEMSYCGSRNLDEIAWYKGNSDNKTHAVKLKKPNKIGLYDMSGNVGEWTLSGSSPLFFVVGGNYECDAEHCEMELHEVDHEDIATATVGLRLILIQEK